MDALKMLNLAVRFLLELCMLAAVGYWGFRDSIGLVHENPFWDWLARFDRRTLGNFPCPQSDSSLEQARLS